MDSRPPVAGISHYALFGEQAGDDDPEFVHIEEIHTRSSLYDWQITPHRHRRMFQFLYMVSGSAEVRLDQSSHRLAGPGAVCIPGGVVHAFSFEPGTQGWVVTVSELLLIDARFRRSRRLLEPLVREPRMLSFADNPDGANLIAATLEEMLREFQWPRPGRAFMFDWMIRIVLMTAVRHLESQTPSTAGIDRQRERYTRFRQLIEDHYREHWPVGAYADALAISQARLNRLCKALAGKSAGELVQDRLALEAQRHLVYTSASTAMIAYELGFQDPAYFSRFFKRRVGMAPGRFRAGKMAKPFPH